MNMEPLGEKNWSLSPILRFSTRIQVLHTSIFQSVNSNNLAKFTHYPFSELSLPARYSECYRQWERHKVPTLQGITTLFITVSIAKEIIGILQIKQFPVRAPNSITTEANVRTDSRFKQWQIQVHCFEFKITYWLFIDCFFFSQTKMYKPETVQETGSLFHTVVRERQGDILQHYSYHCKPTKVRKTKDP